MKSILFVDDDIGYQSIIGELLTLEGYDVDCSNDPTQAIELFKQKRYDLVITDLIMDKIDGLQLHAILRRLKPDIPVIVLTGHNDVAKEIEGLNTNIHDYIYKPVSMDVLVKRVQRAISNDYIEVDELHGKKDNITVNLVNRKVYKNDDHVLVTSKEYDLIVFFLRNKNRIFSRDEMLIKVWHANDDILDSRTVDTHIKNIRAKLDLSSIISVRGIGYEWFE